MSESLEYIERYFGQEMNPDEKKIFEDRCIHDPAFAKEVAVYVMMQQQTAQLWKDEKKEEFDSLEKEGNQPRVFNIDGVKPKQTKVRAFTSWKYTAIAASVVILIGVGITFYLQSGKSDSAVIVKEEGKNKRQQTNDTASLRNPNIDSNKLAGKTEETPLREPDISLHDQLVAKNFKPDKTPLNTEGVLADAFRQYEGGNYKNAISDYKDAITMVEEMDTRSGEDEQELKERKQIIFYAHYYSGLSYLANDNASKAIVELKSVGTSPDKYWQSKVHWYLALAYLKTGKITEAKALLEQVAAGKYSRDYKQKALTLITELKTASKK